MKRRYLEARAIRFRGTSAIVMPGSFRDRPKLGSGGRRSGTEAFSTGPDDIAGNILEWANLIAERMRSGDRQSVLDSVADQVPAGESVDVTFSDLDGTHYERVTVGPATDGPAIMASDATVKRVVGKNKNVNTQSYTVTVPGRVPTTVIPKSSVPDHPGDGLLRDVKEIRDAKASHTDINL